MSWIFRRDENWEKLKKMLEPRNAKKIVKRHIRQATRLNGKLYEKHIIDTIKSGDFNKNSPLTEAIKGSNNPLLGIKQGASLFKAITSKIIPGGSPFNDSVFIGILASNSFFGIASTIHFGKTIKVTEKMRGLFLMLAMASQGRITKNQLSKSGQELFSQYQNWKPLKKTTNTIVIPPREFITKAFEDPKPRKQAKVNWQQALRNAFAEIRASQ